MGGHRQAATRSNFDVNLKRYVTNVLKWRPGVSVLMAHVLHFGSVQGQIGYQKPSSHLNYSNIEDPFLISKAKNLFLNIERQHGNQIRVWFNQKKEGRVLELLYYYETSSSLIYCLCKREYRLNCPAIFVSNCLDSQFSCLNYPNLLSHFNFVLLLHVMLGYQWTIVTYLSIIMPTH